MLFCLINLWKKLEAFVLLECIIELSQLYFNFIVFPFFQPFSHFPILLYAYSHYRNRIYGIL